ncbi:MAG: NUDIX hydrolase, partial [Candidatus Omnitrophica bacterium]|nr:NUDIX hydrolase [Candidatus Omnitrophota bacterium]
MKNKSPYNLLKRKWLHKGQRFQFCMDTIRISGNNKDYFREVIFHPRVAVMIPMKSNGNVLLIRQFRYGAAKYLWEFPAGTCDGKESALACAKRELIEETHYRALTFKKLLSFYPTPGMSTERMHLFLATRLVPERGVPDDDEFIEVREFTPRQAMDMLYRGKIVDAKTLIALLYMRNEELRM